MPLDVPVQAATSRPGGADGALCDNSPQGSDLASATDVCTHSCAARGAPPTASLSTASYPSRGPCRTTSQTSQAASSRGPSRPSFSSAPASNAPVDGLRARLPGRWPAPCRTLNIVDAFTREVPGHRGRQPRCPLRAASSACSNRLVWALGLPESLRVDATAPEFISMTLDRWAFQHGVRLRLHPGRASRHRTRTSRSFNGRFRDECLAQSALPHAGQSACRDRAVARRPTTATGPTARSATTQDTQATFRRPSSRNDAAFGGGCRRLLVGEPKELEARQQVRPALYVESTIEVN